MNDTTKVLVEILKSVNSIKSWVGFIGILVIVALALGGCAVMMGIGMSQAGKGVAP
jgi:hypothetical protein